MILRVMRSTDSGKTEGYCLGQWRRDSREPVAGSLRIAGSGSGVSELIRSVQNVTRSRSRPPGIERNVDTLSARCRPKT